MDRIGSTAKIRIIFALFLTFLGPAFSTPIPCEGDGCEVERLRTEMEDRFAAIETWMKDNENKDEGLSSRVEELEKKFSELDKDIDSIAKFLIELLKYLNIIPANYETNSRRLNELGLLDGHKLTEEPVETETTENYSQTTQQLSTENLKNTNTIEHTEESEITDVTKETDEIVTNTETQNTEQTEGSESSEETESTDEYKTSESQDVTGGTDNTEESETTGTQEITQEFETSETQENTQGSKTTETQETTKEYETSTEADNIKQTRKSENTETTEEMETATEMQHTEHTKISESTKEGEKTNEYQTTEPQEISTKTEENEPTEPQENTEVHETGTDTENSHEQEGSSEPMITENTHEQEDTSEPIKPEGTRKQEATSESVTVENTREHEESSESATLENTTGPEGTTESENANKSSERTTQKSDTTDEQMTTRDRRDNEIPDNTNELESTSSLESTPAMNIPQVASKLEHGKSMCPQGDAISVTQSSDFIFIACRETSNIIVLNSTTFEQVDNSDLLQQQNASIADLAYGKSSNGNEALFVAVIKQKEDGSGLKSELMAVNLTETGLDWTSLSTLHTYTSFNIESTSTSLLLSAYNPPAGPTVVYTVCNGTLSVITLSEPFSSLYYSLNNYPSAIQVNQISDNKYIVTTKDANVFLISPIAHVIGSKKVSEYEAQYTGVYRNQNSTYYLVGVLDNTILAVTEDLGNTFQALSFSQAEGFTGPAEFRFSILDTKVAIVSNSGYMAVYNLNISAPQ